MVDALVQGQLAEILERLDSKNWERLEKLLAEGNAGTMYGCLNLAPLGENGARELMDAAADEMIHNQNIVQRRRDLHERIEEAQGAIRSAEQQIKVLSDLFDAEYEGGSADLKAFLADAGRALRAAQALKPTDKEGETK